MIKKQIMVISLCAAVFAVLTVVYFTVLKPIIEKTVETEAADIQLLDGEELGISNRIMITSKVERSEIKNVQVKNKEDNYKLIHHLGNNTYYVENAEMVPINQETIAGFFTNVGYLLSMERVAAKDIDDGNEILADLEPFGLSPENDLSYFIVTRTDDFWYKIIIGDKIPTTGGYYVMYEDKDGVRPAIYIVDTTIEDTILSTRYSIMLPIVSEPIPQNEIYKVDNFKFYKGRDLFVDIYEGPIDPDSDILVNHQMGYPAPYMVSSNYDSLLYTFVNFSGDRVVYSFSIDEELDEEVLIEFGFLEYSAKITFDFNEREYYYIFSKPNESGNYYILTEFGSIVEISPDKVPFLSWNILKFVDKPIFDQNINDVESITIKVPGKADVLFALTGTGQELEVKGNGTVLDVPTFRQYYKSILSIDLQDFIALSGEADVYKEKEPMVEMVILMRDGFIRDYKLYFVETNTRRCFYTINGSGDFYVSIDKVRKLIDDTDRMLQNLPINADALE